MYFTLTDKGCRRLSRVNTSRKKDQLLLPLCRNMVYKKSGAGVKETAEQGVHKEKGTVNTRNQKKERAFIHK